MSHSRRDILKMLAAGGAIIAGEIWIPGKTLISIPKPSYSVARLMANWVLDFDAQEIRYVGADNGRSISVLDLYQAVQNVMYEPQYLEHSNPMHALTPYAMEMEKGFRIANDRSFDHLTDGTVIQRDEQGRKEYCRLLSVDIGPQELQNYALGIPNNA